MPAFQLEHYNIRTTKLDATVDFYTRVLGLRSGDRPTTTRPGAWLYDKRDIPVVHVSLVDPDNKQLMQELEAHLGKRDIDSLNGSGAIDHVLGRFAGLQDEAVFEHAVDSGVKKWFFVKYFSTFFKYKFLT